MTGLVEIIALGFALLALMTWAIIVVVAPLRRRRDEGPRDERTLAARAWLYAPLWVPAMLLGGALLPGVAGLLSVFADHCAAHAPHHDAYHHHHLCLAHPPYAAHFSMSALLPLGFLILVALKSVDGIASILRDRRRGRALLQTSRPSSLGEDVRILDADDHVALTVGWTAPTVLLSTALVDNVGAETLEVILAHERAHRRRLDPLRAFFDHLAGALLPEGLARHFLSTIALAREQACDEEAVRVVGSPLPVARALTEVARLRMTAPSTQISIASSSLEARIVHILEPPRPSTHLRRRLVLLVITLLVVGAYPVHAGIEQLFATLLH